MRNMTPREKSHFYWIIQKLLEMNVSVSLEQKKYVVSDGFACDGCFDDEKKELFLALDGDDCFTTLIHEYCHAVQNEEGFCKDDRHYYDLFEEYLLYPDNQFDISEIEKATHYSAFIEYDCEKRAVELLKSFYPFPAQKDKIDDYIKKANSYIYTYFAQFKTRQYSKGNSIIENGIYNKKFLDLMSNHFLEKIEDYSKLPDGYLELYLEYCKQKEN